MQNGNNYNYSFKLLHGRQTLMEQTLQIPVANAQAALGGGKDDPAGLEEKVARIMFDVEKAINSSDRVGLRCHIEQLPSDVPNSMHVEDKKLG